MEHFDTIFATEKSKKEKIINFFENDLDRLCRKYAPWLLAAIFLFFAVPIIDIILRNKP
jgi:hypothetical protein